jgi:hypothetical protein
MLFRYRRALTVKQVAAHFKVKNITTCRVRASHARRLSKYPPLTSVQAFNMTTRKIERNNEFNHEFKAK